MKRPVLSSVFLAAAVAAAPGALGAKTSAQLLSELSSPREGVVTSALQELEDLHPEVAATDATVRALTKDPRPAVKCKAARVLGALHADVGADVIEAIASLLDANEPKTVLEGLKALRGLRASSTVPKMIPLLKSTDEHIPRDACRTLAVLGDASVIPQLESLLSSTNPKLRYDAYVAINAIRLRR